MRIILSEYIQNMQQSAVRPSKAPAKQDFYCTMMQRSVQTTRCLDFITA